MLFFAAVLVATCIVGNGLSAATVPLPDKVYYDLEDAANLFKEFIDKHNRKYGSVEEHLNRLEVFKQNLANINELNSKFPNTVFAVNQFADVTSEEMKNYYGFKPINESEIIRIDPYLPAGIIDPVPESFDWRDSGVVSPVKNQGQCGSCYIFSAIGNIESQYARKHQQCLSFSEQQCLDCLKGTTCHGGWPHDVMNHLAQSGQPCDLDQDYPYVGVDSQGCSAGKFKGVAKVQKGDSLNIRDENTLLQSLIQIGPLSVTIDPKDLSTYSGGVLQPDKCGKEQGHAVLLVGYGVDEKGGPFWTIKNSWGKIWGEQGYFRLKRGVNACSMGTLYSATSQVA